MVSLTMVLAFPTNNEYGFVFWLRGVPSIAIIYEPGLILSPGSVRGERRVGSQFCPLRIFFIL